MYCHFTSFKEFFYKEFLRLQRRIDRISSYSLTFSFLKYTEERKILRISNSGTTEMFPFQINFQIIPFQF